MKDSRRHCRKKRATLDEAARFDRMVELSVAERLRKLVKTSTVQNAWKRGARPSSHGWVFDLHGGYVRPQTSMLNDNPATQAVCKFHLGGRS